MATTLKQNEAIPAARPEVNPYDHWEDSGVDGFGVATVNTEAVWQRLEAWIAYRWGEREVVWIVEGGGEWEAPLCPATVVTVEVWRDDAWVETTLTVGPLGGLNMTDGDTYRVTASVGSAEVPPEAVKEAFRRLHELSRGIAEQFKDEAAYYGGEGGRVAAFAAKAIGLSGAADLLKPYRRVGNVAVS